MTVAGYNELRILRILFSFFERVAVVIKDQPGHLSAEENWHLQTQILNVVEQAIMAVDLSGCIVFFNQFAETFYSITQEDILNHNIREIFGSSVMMDKINSNLDKLKKNKVWTEELLIKRRDGTSFIAYVSASLLEVDQNTLVSLSSVMHNKSETQQLLEANRLLAEASALLVDAVDYETPLNTLTQLAVPQLADWCVVHLLQPDGSIKQVALAPADLANMKPSHNWLQKHLPNDEADGLPSVLRSGKPKLVTNVTSDEWAVAASIKSYMIVPLISRPKTLGAVTFVASQSDRQFDTNTLALAENLASHISIYLDKARLYSESQKLNSELEKRVNERTKELRSAITQLKQSESTIQTLFRISNKLNSTLEIETILDELAQEAIRIVDGESGFAGLNTPDGMTVWKYFRRGKAIAYKYSWSFGQGIPGWVLEHKIPYGTSDAVNDPILQYDLEINKDVHSIICTPILDSAGEVLGYFDIRNKRGAEGFTISDQEMLMALAPSASIAIQNGLAYQQRVATVHELKASAKQLQALAANLELAREEERIRISRELHDQLGQALTAMKFDLAWLSDQLGPKDEALAQKASAITQQMDAMIKTVRRISTELRPGMLDDLGLAASIEWQARDFEKRTGILCTVSVPNSEMELSRAQSLALFRIFQESLTNVERHAKASLIEVELTRTSEIVTLQIHDDGRGIKIQEIAGLQSLGLLGMRERAMRLGGEFTIQGTPGDGSLVTVTIPLNNSDHKNSHGVN
jgi:PAS domain S-box-containing protein